MSFSALSTGSLNYVDHQDTALPAKSAKWWMFWLPLAFVVLALYMVEHSTYYASAEFAKLGDGNKVSELVSGGSATRQIYMVLLGALGAALLVLPSAESLAPKRGMLFIIFTLCSLLLTSSLWASDPGLTLKRAVQPILLMVAALGTVKHLRPRQLCQFTAIVSGAMLFIGVAAVVSHGSFGQASGYRFAGTLHPNSQAVNCAALCLASLSLLADRRQAGHVQWRWLAVFLVGALFLLLTRSRTTTAAFGAGVLVYFCIGSSWARKFFIATAVAAAAVCGVLLLLIVDTGEGQLLTSTVTMGRENEDTGSLTGRLPIWESVLGDIAGRPFLGYGYGAFWTSQRVWEYSSIHHWEFNHAHSAYLETTLNIGTFGLLLGLFLILWTAWAATRRYAETKDIGYRFVTAMIAVAMIQGLLDSNFVTIGFAPLLIMMCISMVALRGRAEADTEFVATDLTTLPRGYGTLLGH